MTARRGAVLAGYVAALAAAYEIAYLFNAPGGVSVWFPPAALAAALLLALGPRFLPWVVLARAGVVLALGASRLPWPLVLLSAVLTSLPYAGGAWLLRQTGRTGRTGRLTRLAGHRVVVEVVVLAGAGSLLSAGAGVGLNVALGRIPLEHAVTTALWFWIGDAAAVASLTPAITTVIRRCWTDHPHGQRVRLRSGLTLVSGAIRGLRGRRGWRRDCAFAVAQVGALAVAVLVAYGTAAAHQVLLYPCLLPLLWVAMRRSIVTAGLAVAGANLALVLATHSMIDAAGGVLRVQAFLVVQAIVGLMVAAVCSERRRATTDLAASLDREQAASAQLAAAMQLQREFVAASSHELRTPLASMHGYLELLTDTLTDPGNDSHLDPSCRHYLDVIDANTRRLIRLADDLLLLQRADVGALTVTLAPTDIAPVLCAVRDTLACDALAKDITLQLLLEPDLPAATADTARLEQLLLAVTGNAVKFTPPGGAITVTATRRPGSPDVATRGSKGPNEHGGHGGPDQHIVIAVRDSGPGIDPAAQAHVFTRFYRAPDAIIDAVPGTGLGLAIARDLAHAQYGTLELDSTPGAGTTVTLRLPLHQAGTETLLTPTAALLPSQ